MPKTAIVTLNDLRQHHVEAFIKRIYRLHYDASSENFPALLIASTDDRDNIVCAAGMRTAEDGFFSENYLDHPIEKILSELSATSVDREEVTCRLGYTADGVTAQEKALPSRMVTVQNFARPPETKHHPSSVMRTGTCGPRGGALSLDPGARDAIREHVKKIIQRLRHQKGSAVETERPHRARPRPAKHPPSPRT